MVGFTEAKRGENYRREHKKRNNMKKYIYGIMAMIAGAVAFIACEDDIDEVAMWNRVVDNSSDIAGLKSACDKINYNVSSFEKILEAQNKHLFIKEAYPNEDGYLIVFSDGSFAQLLNGKDGADGKDGKDGINGTNGVDGKDGKDGYVPSIAIKKDVDGIYYWTCDGAFMLDETGSKVPAQGKDGANGINGTNGVDGKDGKDGINGTNGVDGKDGKDGTNGVDGKDGINGTNGTNGKDGKDGVTPVFMIEDGKWYVSYNNKYSWVELGQATGDKGINGITPKLKIEDGYWYVSYDGGKTWEKEPLGKAIADKEDFNSYPVSGYVDGYSYVDLDLPSGLKWATMNIGALKPVNYGNYYAWGDVTTKSDYSSSSYSFSYMKYFSELQADGIVDENLNLTAEFDAATKNWSKNWRMPTTTEMRELIKYCTWSWTTLDGIKGYKVESKNVDNANWIFLPAAGRLGEIVNVSTGSDGYYWCASCNAQATDNSQYAADLLFSVDGVGKSMSAGSYRFMGLTIRPVTE